MNKNKLHLVEFQTPSPAVNTWHNDSKSELEIIKDVFEKLSKEEIEVFKKAVKLDLI